MYTLSTQRFFTDAEYETMLSDAETMMANNPVDDVIIHVPCQIKDSRTSDKVVVAGSAALFMYLMNCNYNVVVPKSGWFPTDTDFFTLGCKYRRRRSVKSGDYVNVTFTKVEDLLLNFDLPICRVAYSNGNLWISAQALYCLHRSGTYNLPMYFDDKDAYSAVIENGVKRSKYMMQMINAYYHKVHGRVNKYSERGFKPNWIDTMEPVSYVKSQFLNKDSFFNTAIDYQ